MIYKESKTNTGYQYETESFFGLLKIDSDKKLDGDILDGMVSLLTRGDAKASIVKGTIKHAKGIVKYVLTRSTQWADSEDYDTDESWRDTPTSTKKLASEPTQKRASKIQTSSWLRRFVVAFREAWKNNK